MASSPKHLSVFFIIITLTSTIHQTQARDSQFFSKVTRENTDNIYDDKKNTLLYKANNVEDQQISNYEDLAKLEEQAPTFNPQTNRNGYNLYSGRENSKSFPSSTTTTPTQEPYTSNPTTVVKADQHEEPYSYGNNNKYFNVNSRNYEQDSIKQGMETGEEIQQQEPSGYFYSSSNAGNDNKKNYVEELQRLDETKHRTGSEYTNGVHQPGIFNNKNGKNYGVEKQGMSDTRFLENGRYFHDINSEKQNQYQMPDYYQSDNLMTKQGMSDTRYLENGRYFHDVNNGKTMDQPNFNYQTYNQARDEQLNTVNRVQYNGNYNNEELKGNNYQFHGNSGQEGNVAYDQYDSNQRSSRAYQYNNNMAYRYHNQYNQDDEDFEFDP